MSEHTEERMSQLQTWLKSIPDHELVTWDGGPVHLLWTRSHTPAQGDPFHAMYYAGLECFVVQPE